MVEMVVYGMMCTGMYCVQMLLPPGREHLRIAAYIRGIAMDRLWQCRETDQRRICS